MFALLLQGIFLGVIVSVPVGPVNVICLQGTVKYGKLYGFKSTIGGTLADSIYAAIAIMGLNVFIAFVNKNQFIFEMVSSLVILTFGTILLMNKTVKNEWTNQTTPVRCVGNSVKSFFLTISNPLTVLFFVAYLANFKISGGSLNYMLIICFVLGVVIGSMLWFYSLSSVVAHFKHRLNINHFHKINKVCGYLLCILALILFVKSIIV
jgi:threonine/homoserine/homoserine lactone efflux protein